VPPRDEGDDVADAVAREQRVEPIEQALAEAARRAEAERLGVDDVEAGGAETLLDVADVEVAMREVESLLPAETSEIERPRDEVASVVGRTRDC